MGLIDADDVDNHIVGSVNLSGCPTINAIPKREHGEWIKDDFTGLIKCSRCKNDAPISTVSGTQYESDFCHNCGAEMR